MIKIIDQLSKDLKNAEARLAVSVSTRDILFYDALVASLMREMEMESEGRCE